MGLHARPSIVTPFLTLRVHTVNRDACTPTRFNTTYARPRSCKGCTIDQSLPRIFLQGPCSRTPWFLAHDIPALPSGVRYAYTGHEPLPLPLPLCLTLATPPFPFLSHRECVFSSLLCLPSPIPSPAPVTRYTFYTYGRRGKARESLIGKLESRGVLATDVPRRTSRGKENERGYPGGPD